MRRNLCTGLAIAGLLIFSVAGASAAPQADAKAILARAKQAMGGDAWDGLKTRFTRVKVKTSGLEGTAQQWDDLETGRFFGDYHLGPISGAQGFDGKTVWSQDAAKQVRIEEGGDALEGNTDDAYRRVMAFWYPQRGQAAIEYAGEKEESGRKFHVLRITPKGGRPFDLWVDAATYLFDRKVEKGGIETRTDYFSDYREVHGVQEPFAGRSTNGDTKYDQLITVESIEYNLPVETARYAPPQPPPPDFAIAGAKTSATIPFELLNNHIYVQVKLNGKGPFRLLFDSGGAYIVTPELAKELGLKSEGALQGRGVGEQSEDVGLSKMGEVQFGEVSLHDQLFAIFPMTAFVSAEGVTTGGLIGYEVFKRFVVKIDYEHSLLTFTLPSAFTYQGAGTVLPFKFNAHIPQVDGEIDGIPGKFDIDTGSRSSLDLLVPFIEKHDLRKHYAPKFQAVTGWGVGGAARSELTRAKLLRLGSVEVPAPVTELSIQKKGAFTDVYVAGNVGAGVLKRFNITFDYTRQQLIFEPNANLAKPDTFDRAGWWINAKDAAFEVLDVVAGGPAEQVGIKVGDKILAIDGRAPAELPLPAARVKLKTDPPGSKLRLRVSSGGAEREVVLTLRDLV